MCPSHLAGTLKYRDMTDVEDKCQRFTLDVATVQLKQFYVSIFCVSQESRFENSCFDLSSWQDVNTMSMLFTHYNVLFGCLDQGGSRNFFSSFNKFGQSTLMRLAQTVQWGKAVGWATGDLRYFPHKIRVGNELAESRKYSLLAGASREPLSKCITVFCARGPGLGWDQQRQ